MNFQHIPESTGAKFMYINQGFLNGIQQNKQLKVLINPNFVHVKPHFNKQFLLNQTIHVNPNKLRELQKPKPISSTIATPTKLIRIPQTSNVCDKNKILVSTRTKLVRSNQSETPVTAPKRMAVHTKYKIIRDSPAKKNIKKLETDIKKLYYIKNRFRIDKRSPLKPSQKLFNKHVNTTLNTKNVYVKCNSKLNKTDYVSINGILYRRSLKLSHTPNKKLKNGKVSRVGKVKLLTIRGQKYKLDSNHRTLTLITKDNKSTKPSFKTIYLGGVTFKQKDANVFIKTNVNQKRVLLSQAKQRSINTLTNKMKKSNIPCPLYRKFGRCKGKEKGTCIRIHNPDQISLCPKFLQGACINDKCLLSHKVSAEKMPTCKFFLEGLCAKDNCPYLHVKISAKADICKDFLQGFCEKAAECDKRHQFLCPDFEKSGKCLKKRCPYPHGSAVRKCNFSKVTAASKLHSSKNGKNHPVANKITNKNSTANLKDSEVNCEKVPSVRYYNESSTDEVLVSNVEIVDLDVEQNSNLISSKKQRPVLGRLPSYIPFLEEEQNES
ncbi:hypothetical protein ILUMI_06317 [Ignelater luminosus]|uniref:Zinc finger CCCH domain-containing protein 3 n=1 Tax=Ignelater luminosus TaxID=2038154 RepID=A0A8K0D8Q0_IGNLU|nr:hypothetical protein ILUMI_06317 [Ignelater luminosus]